MSRVESVEQSSTTMQLKMRVGLLEHSPDRLFDVRGRIVGGHDHGHIARCSRAQQPHLREGVGKSLLPRVFCQRPLVPGES